jgi:hypothetical protein
VIGESSWNHDVLLPTPAHYRCLARSIAGFRNQSAASPVIQQQVISALPGSAASRVSSRIDAKGRRGAMAGPHGSKKEPARTGFQRTPP